MNTYTRAHMRTHTRAYTHAYTHTTCPGPRQNIGCVFVGGDGAAAASQPPPTPSSSASTTAHSGLEGAGDYPWGGGAGDRPPGQHDPPHLLKPLGPPVDCPQGSPGLGFGGTEAFGGTGRCVQKFFSRTVTLKAQGFAWDHGSRCKKLFVTKKNHVPSYLE